MSGYLVDTNIPSELTRLTPRPGVEAFLRQVKESAFLSVLSLGEIRKGILSLASSNKKSALQEWLDLELKPWFSERLLPVTGAIAETWGDLAARSKAKGRPLPVVDGLIAATAIEHRLILVTRNVADYEGLGVRLLSPWSAAPSRK